MAQLTEVTQKFQDPLYDDKTNATGLARLLHVKQLLTG